MDDQDFLLGDISLKIIQKKKQKKRRFWVRPSLNKNVYSGSELLKDLKRDDLCLVPGRSTIRSSFHNFVRMSATDFEELICLIGPKIAKCNTNYRDAIPITERLAVTLRFLGTGDSYVSLSYTFRMSKQIIRVIVLEVCTAIIEVLQDQIKVPSTKEAWQKIADQFFLRWNVPNCIGAMDGKHVALQSPIHSGTDFFNYKSFFSIVLLAVVDANYNILFANVGSQGRISDGGVFNNCSLRQKLEANELNLPDPVPLPGRAQPVPYVILADDAFPLTKNIIKPYPGTHQRGSKERICNYRISRGRRMSENVFGVMASVFRVFRKPMLLQETAATVVTLACLNLHNFMRRNEESRAHYNPPGTYDIEDIEAGTIIPGSWRMENLANSALIPFARIPRKSANLPQTIRDEFCEYFVNEGKVDWQERYA